MTIAITPLPTPPPDRLPVEIVERKGVGHPDTICDAVAEEFSVRLSEYYRETFGDVLHHNVDKVLLAAGSAAPAFGGGVVRSPMDLFLAGRATIHHGGHTVPIADLAADASRRWLAAHLHALDVDHHVRVRCLVREGSADLVDLFDRRERGGAGLANDTSCGVGYAPASELERIVLEVERCVTDARVTSEHPAVGEDVKVLGIRQGDDITLNVACAVVGSHTPTLAEYLETRSLVGHLVSETARRMTNRRIRVEVNSADDPDHGNVYLTVTGTSAEAGDDGQAGRGNRVGGLITPYRPSVMEAAAGKNPVTHVGKLYSVVAHRVARRVVQSVAGISHAECLLASRIGQPVDQPALVHVRAGIGEGGGGPSVEQRSAIEEAVAAELKRVGDAWRDILARRVRLF